MNTEQLKTDDAFEDKYINPIVDSILLFRGKTPEDAYKKYIEGTKRLGIV